MNMGSTELEEGVLPTKPTPAVATSVCGFCSLNMRPM